MVEKRTSNISSDSKGSSRISSSRSSGSRKLLIAAEVVVITVAEAAVLEVKAVIEAP